jgi:2-polyprenyl-3-methyl-5-hydroxy-6-metoxy-1,4-benzoquinol methylase
MIIFRQRSHRKELLDQPDIPEKDLFRNLRELDVINQRLGGYRVSIKGLKEIQKDQKVKSLIDLGFGGGDTIKALAKKDKNGLYFYGADLKEECKRYAEGNLKHIGNKELICRDYRKLDSKLLENIDVIHCSLFLHHLSDEEIIALFKFAKQNNCTLLVNDLHRHWLAYLSIKLLTKLFSKSYLVKNDAPLSVLRGFMKKELISYLQKAGIENYKVKWCWAFRYLIIAK